MDEPQPAQVWASQQGPRPHQFLKWKEGPRCGPEYGRQSWCVLICFLFTYANKLSLSEEPADNFSIVINSGKPLQNSKGNVENLLLSYTKNPVAIVS